MFTTKNNKYLRSPMLAQEEVERVFGIALSLEERAAITEHLDKDDLGPITCEDFITQVTF
jgi:hypothetical protein